ncbi:MAG: AMP-binding protein, partial [Gemmatimonadetes bacterium]|nr:AMP-binding protein [Gemmatimonadota bacterium]
LVALPLFHSFGQTAQMNSGFVGGSTLVLVPRFEPGAVLEAMAREKVDLFSGVPTMFWALLNHAKQHGVDTRPIAETLVICTSGGAAMPVEVLK